MTEEELKNKLDSSFKEIKPIIDQMTSLVMDAYERGFNVGMEVGKELHQ